MEQREVITADDWQTGGADDVLADFEGLPFNQTALTIFMEKLERQNKQREQACLDRVTRCDAGEFHRTLMGHGIVILCAFALVGNCLNLMVYGKDKTRFFIAIRMLCTKVLINTLTCLALLPQAFRAIGAWKEGGESDRFYWKLWPFTAWLANSLGFASMWLTVLMAMEIYVHVFLPHASKSICTNRNLYRSYALIGLFAVLLGIVYPLTRSVELKTECGQVEAFVGAAKSVSLYVYERVHMVFNLMLAIVIPLALLVGMATAITWRLVVRAPVTGVARSPSSAGGMGRFGAEKRIVTRITMITTILQLCGELPSLPVMIYAALPSSMGFVDGSLGCKYQTISQFLAMMNISLSFFVYAAFSPRFRESIRNRFCVGDDSNGRSSRSSFSQRLSTTKLEDQRLLNARGSTSVQRNSSASSSDDVLRPSNGHHFITLSPKKTSDVVNLL